MEVVLTIKSSVTAIGGQVMAKKQGELNAHVTGYPIYFNVLDYLHMESKYANISKENNIAFHCLFIFCCLYMLQYKPCINLG